MSEQTEMFAERFEEAHNAVLAALAACTDDEWRVIPPGEDRTVGQLFHHIGVAYEAEVELFKCIINKEPIPYIYQADGNVDPWNAEYAEQYKDCSKAETTEVLERNRTMTVQFIRNLSNVQLQATYPPWANEDGIPPTVEVLMEGLIDHAMHHLRDIKVVSGH